jgi:cyclopropane fatty-acyl-phospholipid synthase-like methyltransferase
MPAMKENGNCKFERSQLRDWQAYWNEVPKQYGETEFLKQVCKTTGGKSVSNAVVNAIVSNIVEELSVGREDHVLDLCCGNGLLSANVSGQCAAVVGVDLSAVLIAVARKYHQTENVEYFCRSILDPALYAQLEGRRITRICLYEGLQYFRREDLRLILQFARNILPNDGLVFFGSIPDAEKIWSFYNTPDRKAEYLRRMAEGTEAIGTWWNKQQLREIGEDEGFSVEILTQKRTLHTAHYRFDARIRRSR